MLQRRVVARCVAAAVVAGFHARAAPAQEEMAQTVGAWVVACHRTEAGGRECEMRNDEEGKPALEQHALLSLTLSGGRNDADALVRIAGLDLPHRLDVVLAFSEETMGLEGVGRRGRLAARFTIPRQELAGLAAAPTIEVRFADKAGQEHAVSFAPQGLEEALTIAQEHLSP